VLQEVKDASCLAGYVSMPGEPGTQPLLAALSARGTRVLLPLLQVDFDLGWATYEPGALASARFGISEPTGVPLGLNAINDASLVICPGLAGDAQGHRLGRGGGSYDRVLSRVDRSVRRVMLLYDDEVLDAVPTDAHDERVHLIATPTRSVWTSFSRET
jgi:5-formyltetrahydrofolate cyclo-ligase